MSATDDTETSNESSSLPNMKDRGPLGVAYAYVYLTALIFGLIGVTVYAAQVGFIQTNITLTFNANLGWILEYFVAALVGVFSLWTFIQIVRVTGAKFISGLTDRIASIADSYDLP